MNYKGVIIEESLEDKDVLKNVAILSTKVEEVTEKHKTPWLKQWTLHTVEIPKDGPARRSLGGGGGEGIAEKLSQSLESQHAWYADFKNDEFHYIIFRNKVFKVDLQNPKYREAMEYDLFRNSVVSAGLFTGN